MRGILIGCSLGVVILGLAWVFAGRRISMALDRATLNLSATALSADPIFYESGALRIGDPPLMLVDINRLFTQGDRLSIVQAGRSFALGALRDGSRLAPDPGDQIALTVRRSLLSWPTPFEMNFMTGRSPSWKRHLYYRLTWRKQSGEELEMVWRYEQWFYGTDGWAGGFMTNGDSTGLVRVAW